MMRTRFTATIAVVLLAAAGCGGDPVVEAQPAAPTSAATTLAKMAPADACRKASLLVGDATTKIIGELVDHPDASTINIIELKQMILEMRGLVPHMPEETLAGDLEDLIEPLDQLATVIDTGKNRSIETGIYASRGPGLIMSCGRYV